MVKSTDQSDLIHVLYQRRQKKAAKKLCGNNQGRL